MRASLFSVGMVLAVVMLLCLSGVSAQLGADRLARGLLGDKKDDKIGRRELQDDGYGDPTDAYATGPPPYYSKPTSTSTTSVTCKFQVCG